MATAGDISNPDDNLIILCPNPPIQAAVEPVYTENGLQTVDKRQLETKSLTKFSLPTTGCNQLVAIDKIRSNTSGNCKEEARHPNCIMYIRRSTKLLPVHVINYSRVLEDVLLGRASRIV